MALFPLTPSAGLLIDQSALNSTIIVVAHADATIHISIIKHCELSAMPEYIDVISLMAATGKNIITIKKPIFASIARIVA